jgi:hypothetical protein
VRVDVTVLHEVNIPLWRRFDVDIVGVGEFKCER